MQRKLATRGPKVSGIGLGCMGLNYAWSDARQVRGDLTDPRRIYERSQLLRYRRSLRPLHPPRIWGHVSADRITASLILIVKLPVAPGLHVRESIGVSQV